MEVITNIRAVTAYRKHLQCLHSMAAVHVKLRKNENLFPHLGPHSVRFKTGYGKGIEARVQQVALEESTEQSMKENDVKPSKHPGIFYLPKVTLPEKFRHAAEKILLHEHVGNIKESAEYLRNYIWSRRLPMEHERYRQRALKVEEEIRAKDEAILPFLSEEETVRLNQSRERQVLNRLRYTIYHWEPIVYTKQKALEYLLGRSAAEYAILCRIFGEVAKRDPQFHPKTLCDFGSGVGTVTWAARTYWDSSLYEHLCADVSSEMNQLAELLLRGGSKNDDHSIPALFFRQHLPESGKIRYDLVVSAFSLMELPSAKERLTTIDKLWKKTEDCLVVVEAGTIAGFQAIIQARNYILGLDSEQKRPTNCHVFSPCPSSSECPRFSFDVIPCNFEVKYRPLYPFHHDNCENERFCYVVIRRGPPKTKEQSWPRLVENPLKRPRHVICRMCTKDGTISETVLTKAKHSQQLRFLAKRSHWGDLIPFEITHNSQCDTDQIETD